MLSNVENISVKSKYMGFYSLLKLTSSKTLCFILNKGVLFHGVLLKTIGIRAHESSISECIYELCGNVGCGFLETANPALL